MIAVEDIGWFGARAFTEAIALNRREIDLAGDIQTMPEAAEILTDALDRPIAFAQTPIEQVRQYCTGLDPTSFKVLNPDYSQKRGRKEMFDDFRDASERNSVRQSTIST